MTRVLRTMIALVFAVGLQPVMAFAQTAASGNIEGVVTDASGAVLPGVTVVIKNLDTNVARVLKRVFAPSADVKTTKGQRTVWGLAESLLPRTGRATWTHNQALMELGALVCTARVAHCGKCPVRSLCRTAAKQAVVARP